MGEPLRPCQCGGEAKMHGTMIRDGKATRWYVVCSDPQKRETCWIGPTMNSQEEAAAAWNADHPVAEAGLREALLAVFRTRRYDETDEQLVDRGIAALSAPQGWISVKDQDAEAHPVEPESAKEETT